MACQAHAERRGWAEVQRSAWRCVSPHAAVANDARQVSNYWDATVASSVLASLSTQERDRIVELQFFRNRLESLPPEVLSFPHLRVLSLGSNRVRTPGKPLEPADAVAVTAVAAGNIAADSGTFLSPLHRGLLNADTWEQLRTLSCYDNCLARLPSTLTALTALQCAANVRFDCVLHSRQCQPCFCMATRTCPRLWR